VKTTAYLVVEPKWSRWRKDTDGNPALESIKVVRVVQSRPKTSGVAVKLTIEIPEAAFMPLRPEATIEVAMGDLETIVVEAEPAAGDGAS
jgi:hypothetical protein